MATFICVVIVGRRESLSALLVGYGERGLQGNPAKCATVGP